MNFFEHQDRARRQSRWLVFVFLLSVLAVVVAIEFILLLALGVSDSSTIPWQPLSAESMRRNSGLLAAGACATLLVIGLASLFKTWKLRSGGGEVARELGATLVEPDTLDPLRRRLRNVVEEIALASGVPVPEIYVLERELGINAFAAGYTPADAAVTVTRGALERLSREELQGVVAHEFSHILNGDMRINIRLMGALFGILLLALIGRRVILHTRYFGRSRGKGAAAIMLIAVGLMAVGYIGLFFGRWIKASVSRQREYLADASAVQFTRAPDGVGGALKKIAVYREGSYLAQDTEEISHMLFGDGQKMHLFSTHPPLLDRISRIEPRFRAEDLDELRARMANDEIQRARQRSEESVSPRSGAPGLSPGRAAGFDSASLIGQIGQPNRECMLLAAELAASLSGNIRQAAQSVEWAPETMFFSVLDADAEIREQQLLLIAQRMGTESESRVRALLGAGVVPLPNQRMPLMELAFPALKRRPAGYVTRMLTTVQELVRLDGRIDVFEYMLARLLSQYVWESQNPHRTKASGKLAAGGCVAEISRVLSVLAGHGHKTHAGAEAAYRAGMQILGHYNGNERPEVSDWTESLDADLPCLDRMHAQDKEQLVKALLATVTHDEITLPVELELLRVIGSMIHVPIPMLMGAIPAGPQKA
ncbi:MAG TPA: M48 family metallopeptidase [Xanthomonadales bacterium]|nr:M48 family metallopeptidase [Xanthomonadales bacterium]